jgi:hypothetical protein
MFSINEQILTEFGSKINYNVISYLDSFNNFYRFNYPRLVGFYNGRFDDIPAENFNILKELINTSNEITNAIEVNNHLLEGVLDWEMVDFLSDIKIELWTINRTDKFLRSTIVNPNYTTEYEFNQTMGKETIEDISFDVLTSETYNNDWVDIAKRNDLSEIGYDILEGGNELTLSINLNNVSIAINSIIDNPNGENIFGKDIDRNVKFIEDDIFALVPTDTIYQTVAILAELMKRDVPEFKDFGRSGFIGNNIKVFAFSSMVRQLTRIFSSDDTLTNFSVKNFNYVNSSIFLEFQVSSRLDLIVKTSLEINNL